MKRWQWAILLILVGVGIAAIYTYTRYRHYYPATEDAYLEADVVRVAAQVSGLIHELAVTSQQPVQRGQLLLTLDETVYRAQLERAEAQLALAHRQVAENHAEVAAAEAALHSAQVTLANAERHRHRAEQLETSAYLSRETAEDIEADYRRAEAGQRMAEAALEQARSRLGSEPDDLIREAEAAVSIARWQLAQTRLTAPCDGFTEDVDLYRHGSVQAHRPLFVIVCSAQWWVQANFKETQLSRIRVGQAARITIDMYPGQVFKGVVESLGPASGTAFSMLPPENATGNWVKVTQRVPIRVRLMDVTAEYPLRVGTSTVIRVDTVSGSR